MRKKILALIASIFVSANTFADDSRSDFYNKMKSIVDKKEAVIINTPEEYIYNLATTDFIKGLMNQYASFTRNVATTKNKSELNIIKEDLYLNVICVQSALGYSSKEHYDLITKLSIQGLDEELYKENIKYLIDNSESLRSLSEVPKIMDMCAKEGQIAKSFGEGSKIIRESKR